VLLSHCARRCHRQRQGPDGWFSVTSAQVYFDHPSMRHSSTRSTSTLSTLAGTRCRVAVELSADSARELVRCIEAALEAAGEAAR